MSLRRLLALAAGLLVAAALAGESSTATAGRSGCSADGSGGGRGYTYAGHQADHAGHGVRATITATRPPHVDAGHVAGWVGVGGPGLGPNGEDTWIQAGIASVVGSQPYIYAEIARGGRYPQLIVLDRGVGVGESRGIAVLELANRPGWWRVWLDGNPVTKPVRLRGSSGRWAPIATAESFDAGEPACNAFGFRFERVSVSYGGGGSWRPFVSGHRFLDRGHKLRALATAPAESGAYARKLSADGSAPLPYAFVASS